MTDFRKTRILVAEDDPSEQLFLSRAFQKAGLYPHLRFVEDGTDVVSYLEGTGKYADRIQFPLPHLLLLDIKMPRMTGLEVLRWLRAHPLHRRIPAVMLTNSSLQTDIETAYDVGVNSYLVKPPRWEELIELARWFHAYWVGLNQGPSPFTVPDSVELS